MSREDGPSNITAQAQGGDAVGKLRYMPGYGSEFETEAIPGALPIGQNSPQKPPHGLVSELVSGASFSAPRALNKRSYLFRIRPTALQGRFEQIDNGLFLTPPFSTVIDPNHHGWYAFNQTNECGDFIDGIATMCGNGSPLGQSGMALHAYHATRSMVDRVFSNADAEMVVAPHLGGLRLVTEFGILEVHQGELAVLPKGIKFRVELLDGDARGFLFENFGLALNLPELGIIGGHGLANAIDFQTPVAAFEDVERRTEVVHKYAGNLWSMHIDHSPLDVVAWRGSLYPYKYDLRRIVPIGPLGRDHPDPSILTVLTSPSDHVMGPNLDIMAFTPRWAVTEHSFRPPGYHRNTVSEIVVVLEGGDGGIGPGGMHFQTNFVPHGPATHELEAGREQELIPQKIEGALLIVAESRFPLQVTEFGRSHPGLAHDYLDQWSNFPKRFPSVE